MIKNQIQISAARIKAARPGDRLADGTVPGLSLLVQAGCQSWYLYYRTKDRRERRPKLGDYSTLGIADARKLAREFLYKVAHGEDPVAARREHSAAERFDDFARRYLREHADGKKTKAEDARMLGAYVLPRWRAKRVVDITYDDVSRLHTKLRDSPYQANRVLSLISKMMNLAERWGVRPPYSNPCRFVRRFRERPRRRYMHPEEAAAISRELDKYAKSEPAGVAFVYLLILTGARKSEIANAKWHQVKGDRLVLEEHKTDAGGDIRTIHLPAPVREVLGRLPVVDDGTITGVKDPKKLWNAVRKAAGCPDLRLHDLRHSFASAALTAGYTLHQIGELLGHKSAQTTKRYAHLADELAAEAAATTAETIARHLVGSVMQDRPEETGRDHRKEASA